MGTVVNLLPPVPVEVVVVNEPGTGHLEVLHSDDKFALIEGCVPTSRLAYFLKTMREPVPLPTRASRFFSVAALAVGLTISWLAPSPLSPSPGLGKSNPIVRADVDRRPTSFVGAVVPVEVQIVDGQLCRNHRGIRIIPHSMLPRCDTFYSDVQQHRRELVQAELVSAN